MSFDEYLKDFNRQKPRAWNEVFHYLHPILFRYICQIIDDGFEADEIVQNMFKKIWEKKTQFDTMGGLRSYLFKGAKNGIIDYQRRKASEPKKNERLREHELQTHDDEPGPDAIAKTELCNRVKAEIKKLSPQRRETVERKLLQEMEPDEIAAAMKINRSTVYKHLRAGYAQIRKKFPKFPLKSLE